MTRKWQDISVFILIFKKQMMLGKNAKNVFLSSH